jgi:hypothetical protein
MDKIRSCSAIVRGLQSARVAGRLLRNFSERSGSRGEVRGSPVGMIDEVIGLSAELDPILPVDGESFDEREILVLQPRRVDVVANTALKVNCPSRRRGPDRISTVRRAEPLRAAGSTALVKAAPGLSTETLLTVTVGWKGELPPGKILSMIPLFSTNLPPPRRSSARVSTTRCAQASSVGLMRAQQTYRNYVSRNRNYCFEHRFRTLC